MKKLYFIVWIIVLLASCGNEHKGKKNDIILPDTINFDKNITYVKYDIPLPIELFRYSYEQKIFDERHLAKEIKNENFNSQTANAQKLGLFSADLAYTTLIGNGQFTLDYSNICRIYAEKLDLSDAYDVKYLDRIKENIDNSDSLIVITNQMYAKTCDMLERRGDKNILPFVIYAGWIESAYLTFYSDEKQNVSVDTNLLISKLNFQNLIDYLYDVQIETSAYFYNDELKNIISQLTDIKAYTETPNLSEQQKFLKLKQKIEELRTKILSL
jgi:hypothetical protein